MAKKKNEALLASLRRFVRTKGADFLRDDNVSSIGIGYKVENGKPTNEIAVQFTVKQKAEPEALGALGTELLPKSIVVDGVVVPTDVLERDYRTNFQVVAERTTGDRKARLDPIAPGVSVGHVKVSAGTIGCIVYDQVDGTPYVLSNWHVLHGPDGAIGEVVVQPGPHDDNRVERNRLGTLVRSHLGAAGDCAIATVEGREFAAEIVELGVSVDRIGEPELGDKVVKSGRTTGVTHGVVRRVDTIVKLDYGGAAGVKEIGCFEIGPDPAKPTAGGEISMGGDSGAAWVFKSANGKPGKTLAGLHFGGEAGGSTDEHALACLPQSVFEKLGVTLKPPRPEAKPKRSGFAVDFLGVPVGLPVLGAAAKADAVVVGGTEVVDYTHFSLAQSKSRRFAFWVAWNIDGKTLKAINRSGIPFVLDPRLPAQFQVGDDLYRGNRLDRGHVARRADLLWGSRSEAEQANVDSFCFTNITPQMDDFNQSARQGLWGRLEEALLADVEVDDLRVSVYGGPVFQADDRVFRGVRLPREYWKVVAFVEQGVLKARAFVLTQNLNQLEALELDEFRVFQVKLTDVEARCGFTFPQPLHAADTLAAPESLDDHRPLDDLSAIEW
ncbi:DNA/RNA non-specific endonuclease [Actinosynnema sp. NPDC047251]|uniref:DNA/RNA endonuclease n=1 Tax=Saccharothrix espanaensis (strain ATCC 51144 / DSM 44229 / JCM 9112 / NBRC 15066 / NRRL 15764) TaxID=1179773 RepID=K0JZ94_SACES|nr:DNA/RNA non-specific endonuclease [Saccharothrix espanaensis]CCH29994.1 DNA/RNA endonuclease [Saccharothrix espanaensis DSM 44229]